jgi:hypothetical protein
VDVPTLEPALAQQAAALLRGRLPASWKIDLIEEPDTRLLIGTQVQGQQQLLVETVPRFKPSDLDALNGRLGRRLRLVGGITPILLVSNYLSPKSRETLITENINFIDLSGNVRIALDNNGIFIEFSARNPLPEVSRAATLRGATAGRLIRFLVDVQPPYRILDLERATGINKGYVSRLLEALVDEGLIEREPRGPVTSVDWQSLLSRRSRDVNLYRTNTTFSFIARSGIERFCTDLGTSSLSERFVITGSVAARRLAPIAAASSLIMYSKEQSEVVRETFDLIPASEGATLIILRPPNDLPFVLIEKEKGLRYAAPSQVAIDCLSGPGRMPAEGEALIAWMTVNEQTWRCQDIDTYQRKLADARA